MRGIAILLVALALASPAGAQSRYSLRGWGEPALPARAAARALGAAEAASSTPTLTGNPANLSQATLATFYGSYVTEWVKTEERTESGTRVRQDYSGVISNLCLAFPLGPVTFGAGFVVGRRAGGTIQQTATTSTGESYLQILEADGNLLRLPALLAGSWKGIELGGGLDVLLLNAKRRWTNDFDTVDGFTTSSDLVRTSQWGVSWRGGVRVPVGSRLRLGGWISWPGDLSGTRTFENDDPSGDLDGLERDADAEVAPATAVGFELHPFAGVRVVGDWVREAWKDVAPPDEISEFVDVDRFAAGIEWAPGIGGPRWPVRVGYRTENLHTLDVAGREVREHFVTAGSGFSVGNGRGEIDWFLEYGQRGDPDEREFGEQVWRAGLTLTGSERWSRRRPPEEETEDW